MEILLICIIEFMFLLSLCLLLIKGLSKLNKSDDDIECVKIPIIPVDDNIDKSIDEYFANQSKKYKIIHVHDEYVLYKTGFVKCEWDPEPSDQCEKCKKENIQMYFCRTDYWENEGIYWCIDCIHELYKQNVIDMDFK